MYRNDIYTCVYETKDGEIGYASFDNEKSLLELLNECRENGDKILDACKVEDRYEFKNGKFEPKCQRMYGYAIIKALKEKHKDVCRKLRRTIDTRIDLNEKLKNKNVPYCEYKTLQQTEKLFEESEQEQRRRQDILRELLLDVCYEAVWECDNRIDKTKI